MKKRYLCERERPVIETEKRISSRRSSVPEMASCLVCRDMSERSGAQLLQTWDLVGGGKGQNTKNKSKKLLFFSFPQVPGEVCRKARFK